MQKVLKVCSRLFRLSQDLAIFGSLVPRLHRGCTGFYLNPVEPHLLVQPSASFPSAPRTREGDSEPSQMPLEIHGAAEKMHLVARLHRREQAPREKRLYRTSPCA